MKEDSCFVGSIWDPLHLSILFDSLTRNFWDTTQPLVTNCLPHGWSGELGWLDTEPLAEHMLAEHILLCKNISTCSLGPQLDD